MNKEEINTICNCFIAFSSFFGAGGAFAYYFREILQLNNKMLLIMLITYLFIGIFLLLWIKEVVKNGKDKSNLEMD